jgi:hypothetical protein
MPNKTFLVRLRSNATQQVRAAKVEVHGKHLAFLTAKGKLAAVFHLDLVESWNEIEPDYFPLNCCSEPAFKPSR